MTEQRDDTLRIVVADGDREFAEGVAASIESVAPGASVETVASVETTLERASDEDELDGLVAGDELDGLIVGDELDAPIETIAGVTPRETTQVVFLTDGGSDGETVSAAIEAGVDDCFPRTTATQQYELVVEAIADGSKTGAESRAVFDETDPESRAVFENVSDGLVVHDPETGEIIAVNERFCEMNGYERAELVGETIGLVTAPDEAYSYEAAVERIERAAEEGAQLFEWRNQHKNGETFPVEVHLAVVEFDGVDRVLASVRDISERQRRERIIRALHDTTDRLQRVDTPEAVCEATVDAARAVLDLSMPACWLPGEEGQLEPVAASESAWEIPGGPGVFEPGSFEHEIFEGDELVTYDPRERWDQTPLQRAFLVPLGDHGLLGAAEPAIEQYDEVTLDAARILARHATSALDRVKRARELRESERRFRTIAERVDEIIYMTNADLTEVEYVNEAYADVYGRPVAELYENPRAFVDAVHPDDADAYEADLEAMISDIRAGDPDEDYEFSFRIQRPDGEIRWLEATGYPILAGDEGSDRFVGVVEDVTERKRREQTLETFHEATRELTSADSRELAARRAVQAAEDVLGFPLVSVHLYDDETGELAPVAATERLRDLDVAVPSFGPGDSLAWAVYVEGESTTDTAAAADVYGPGVSGPDVLLPLGPHGVMLVGEPTGSFDPRDVELAQILAATLQGSLNHVADERALAEREAKLERQQARARRLERLNEIIRDIEQATIDQSARAGIERAVCERLVAVDPYDLVWIAEPSVGEDALRPRASDGDMDAYVDALSLEIEAPSPGAHPVVTAYRDGESLTVTNVATNVTAGEWRTTALQHGVQSVVAVPIRHENTVHGILAVESRQPDAFDEATGEVLDELGRSIGYAITVTERKQALESEGTTELEFALDDEGLFMIRAAAETDCQVALERTIRRSGGSFSMVYRVEGGDPDRLVELAAAAASVERAQVVSTGDDDASGLIDVRSPTWFGSVFTEYGAVLRKATADANGGSLVVEAPRGADIRALVEGFTERYPGADLVAQRQRERTVKSLFELQDTLRDGLTDRQWEALETAYSAGYFAWPRETSGEEVAELLGVTQPTFNKHLRTAERTAFQLLLERDYPDPA